MPEGEWWADTHMKATERDYRYLKALLTGKVIAGTVSGMATKKEKLVPRKSISGKIREFEQNGVIVGYIPVLSDQGKKYFKSLEELYGGGKD